MVARKDNKEYSVDQYNKNNYLNDGYDIYDDNGKIIEYSPKKTIGYNEYVALSKEKEKLEEKLQEVSKQLEDASKTPNNVKELKEEIKTLKAENVTLKQENETLTSKVSELEEKLQSETDENSNDQV